MAVVSRRRMAVGVLLIIERMPYRASDIYIGRPAFSARSSGTCDDMQLALDSTVKLRGGGLLPRLGLGVYQSRGNECENAVKEALVCGYKHGESDTQLSRLG